MTSLAREATQKSLSSPPSTPVDLDQELATGFAGRFIRRKARQLVGKAGFTQSDRPDIEQELSLALYERHARFDATIAPWPAFVATVVSRFAATLLAARRTRKRHAGCIAGSLSSHNVGEDGRWTDLAQRVESRHVSALTGHHSRDEFECALLKIDLVAITERLPSYLQHLCFWLQYESVTETARRMHRSRTALYRRIARVRQVFAKAGLRDFLRT